MAFGLRCRGLSTSGGGVHGTEYKSSPETPHFIRPLLWCMLLGCWDHIVLLPANVFFFFLTTKS